MLRKDITDVVLATLSENLTESLSSGETLGGESIGVFPIDLGGLLAVADHVDGRGSLF